MALMAAGTQTQLSLALPGQQLPPGTSGEPAMVAVQGMGTGPLLLKDGTC